MRYLVLLVLLVLLFVPMRNARAGDGDDFLVPKQPPTTYALALPSTGDLRMDLTALMTLSASLLALADAVQAKVSRHQAADTAQDEPEPEVIPPQPKQFVVPTPPEALSQD